MLTEAKIKRLAPDAKPYRVSDIPTLALIVQKSGRKSFLQRLTIHGKQKDIRIGDWPAVTLASARQQADENRAAAKAGRDPRQVVEALAVPTFAEAQEFVIALHRGNWRNAKTEKIWRSDMNRYAAELLPLPVDQITVRHLEKVLAPIWTTKRETARRMKQRLGSVLKWAYAHGHRDGNPADLLDMILPRQKRTRRHFAAVPFAAVPASLDTIGNSGAWWATRAAFRFAVLTASRSGEVRNLRWTDLDGSTATIPGDRMKAGRTHIVPLSRQALAVIEDAREYSDGSGLVFPSQRGKVMTDSTISKLVRSNGIDGTPHGFRSSFRNWAAEKTSFPRAIAELCLAHVNDNETEAAYLRTDMMEQRAALLQSWADFAAPDKLADNVVTADFGGLNLPGIA